VQEVLKKDLPYLSFPQALSTFFLEGKRPVVITGTHGKTTTSALMAWVLESAGRDPGCMIGGWARNFSGNSKLGRGSLFVVEGDEYDTAFFDKGPKFLHYRPNIGVITSIEFDHGDIYPDLESIQKAFRHFVELLPSDGLLVAAHGDPHIDEILSQVPCSLERYGLDPAAEWSLDRVEPRGGNLRFRVLHKGRPMGDFESPLMGYHNLKNALSVIAVATHLGISVEEFREGLIRFKGVRRRQEVVGEVNGILVMDDFAHHPTAIHETLSGIRIAYPGRRLWAIFEPRSATSRRNVFQEAFAKAFRVADCVVIADLFAPDKIPPTERLDPKRLVEDVREIGQDAWFLAGASEIVREIAPKLKRGDLVCIMSSGAFDGIHGRLLRALEEQGS
jgi:UDP-N-acetylmuramate: L-alanyl-gamma-D-glutamyl-meso-diaminopimelate ligase